METLSETWMGYFTTTQFTYVYRNLTNEVDYVFRGRAVSAIGAGTYAIKTTSGRLSNVLHIRPCKCCLVFNQTHMHHTMFYSIMHINIIYN